MGKYLPRLKCCIIWWHISALISLLAYICTILLWCFKFLFENVTYQLLLRGRCGLVSSLYVRVVDISCVIPPERFLLYNFTFLISIFVEWNRYVYLQASRSNYSGYLHVLEYLLLLYLSRNELCRQIGLQTAKRDIFAKLPRLDVCRPTWLDHSFLSLLLNVAQHHSKWHRYVSCISILSLSCTILKYSTSNNVVPLNSGLRVIQGHWIQHHSIDRLWVFLGPVLYHFRAKAWY